MQRSATKTLLLALLAFTDSSNADAGKVNQITPDVITRAAFDKVFQTVELSSETGPRKDGKIELIDAAQIPAKFTKGGSKAYIVRLQSTRGMDSQKARRLGECVQAYLDQNGSQGFATAGIGIIDESKTLYGRWNTLLLEQDKYDNWTFINLRFTSVQASVDDAYAVLRSNKLAYVDGSDLLDTLRDTKKLNDAIGDGYELTVVGDKKGYLVRADINNGHAAAAVSGGYTTFLDSNFQMVGGTEAIKTDGVIMPTIHADGSTNGGLTSVNGNDEDWNIKIGTPRDQVSSEIQGAFSA